MITQCNGFNFIAGREPKVMILGTMPSVQSMADDFYYAHPRNAFWPIMNTIFNQAIETQKDKIRLIEQSHCLLWDVLSSCERQGSLDSAIKKPVTNDFERLFKQYPSLQTILFNGQAAEKLFKRYVVKSQRLPDHLSCYTLPSTSPANARLTLEDKRLKWQAIFLQIE